MEWICVSSRNACYRRAPDLRLRPVPEAGYCLVYAPSVPNLYSLNTSAWLVLELSDGRDLEEIAVAFHRETEPLASLDEARAQVATALDDLVMQQLVIVGG
jgi:hypothetical protein